MKQLFLALLLNLPIYSQTPEHGMLWKITGPGIEKASYLYGKIPAFCSMNLSFMSIELLAYVPTYMQKLTLTIRTLTGTL